MRVLKTILASLTFVGGVGAAQADPADDLIYAMGLREMVAIMQAEGMAYGDTLADELFPDNDRTVWTQTMLRIHDPKAMENIILQAYDAVIADTDVSDLLTFFADGPGAQIVEFELDARAAMLDEDVEEATLEAYRATLGEETPRLKQIEQFVEANDLIEANVAGALNASFKFYAGLVDGGALDLTEGEIIDDVWAQEDDTRADSREWVYGFLLLAYGGLDDEVMQRHIALARSEAGQAVNRALFAGFNTMYDELSYAIGLAAAQHMQMTDL